MSATSIEIEFAKEKLWLLADRALYWPEGRTLLVADVHLGKATCFRQSGIPVPSGTTKAVLLRLHTLTTLFPLGAVYFLGDLFHNPKLITNAIIDSFRNWRRQVHSIDCFLIPGNHDKAVSRIVTAVDLKLLTKEFYLPPFTLVHNVEESTSNHTIAGHIHPIYRLKNGLNEKLKFPCFVVEPHRLILPAFGEFVGGYVIDETTHQKKYICCEESIFEV